MNGSKFLRMTLLAVFGMMGVIATYAQQITVKGVVRDAADNSPIPGASVVVKSTTRGTITDYDGNFTMNANQGDILVITFIGYKGQEVAAASQINVALEPNTQELDDVVVIGYGVAKKNDMTGSVTAIKPDDINKGLQTSAQDMLQGKVAGVNIVNNGGEPGGGSTIRIRGGSSLNASNDPLIVIDGLAMDNYGMQGSSNALALVNPNDIESFTVLKDASATAIYGSRASNGVIIITTKKGKTGSKPHISYNGNMSFSKVKETLDVMNASEYMAFIKDLTMNTLGLSEEEYYESEQYNNLGYYDANGNHLFADTDWQDEVYRATISTDHNITVSGGTANMPYRVSVGYTKQNGVVKHTDYERLTASFNLSPSFLEKHLTLNINGKGMLSKTHYTDQGAAIGGAISMDPTKPVHCNTEFFEKNFGGFWQWANEVDRKDPEWTYGPNTLATGNPVAAMENYSNEGKSKAFVGNIEADYKIHGFEDLHLHVNGGLDYTTGKTNKNYSPFSTANYYYGNYGWDTQDTYNMSLNIYAQYLKNINEANRLDVMAGYEWQHFHKESDYNYCGYYQGSHLNNPYDIYHPSEGITKYKTENFLVSFFGRLNYTLLDKYLFTFTLRNDGSSRFADGNRWGLFPSAAFAWRAKDEEFLTGVDFISDLKVRLGWGKTGQQEGIGDYIYLPTYTPNKQGAYYPIIGDGSTYRPDAFNKELTWETTTTYNAGIDYGMFDNKIVIALDYYYRKTTDLINTVTVPVGTNFSNKVTSNIGSLHNQGIEASLTYRILQNKDWRWEVGYNLTWNNNQIDKLVKSNGKDYRIAHGGIPIGDSSTDGVKAYHVDQAVSAYYVYQQVYDANGKPIEGEFVDRNADGIINDADRYYYKKSDADVTMGLTSKLMFKNWDFSFSLRANVNNYAYNAVEASHSNLSLSNVFSGNAWHNVIKMGAEKNWDATSVKDVLSDYFIQNASFIKCDNITLGYSFDKLFGSKLNGRVYLTGQNVFTITKYKGLDPEINGGYDNNIYPRPFTGILGLSLNF